MNTIEMNLKGFSDFEQLKQTVEDQGEIIRQQAEQIHRLQDTVSQLLGGLYNHKKQGEMLALHTAVIYGDEPDKNERDDTDYYTIWPTTRQGDVLEQKVAELEKKMTRIGAIFSEKQRPVATLPVELLPPKKITNSKWLCGNE
jgi:hypothetical protein